MRAPVVRVGWHPGARHGALDLYGADGTLLGTVAWEFERKRWAVVVPCLDVRYRYTFADAAHLVERAGGYAAPDAVPARWEMGEARDELRAGDVVIGYVRTRGRLWIGVAGGRVLAECETRSEARERLAALLGCVVA